MPNATPEELRDLAEWYRERAKLAGADAEREHRLALAECLDRLAAERELDLLQSIPVVDSPPVL